MKRRKLERLLHRLDGAAPGAPAPAEQEDLDRLRALRTALHQAVHRTAGEALHPFFAERVMRRLAVPDLSPEEALARSLAWVFRRVAAAALVLLVLLTAYHTLVYPRYGSAQSVVEAALSLPPVSLDTAYELDLAPTAPLTEQDLAPTP